MENNRLDAPQLGPALEITPPCGDGTLTILYEQNAGDMILMSLRKEIVTQLDTGWIHAGGGGYTVPKTFTAPLPPKPVPKPGTGIHTVNCGCNYCGGCDRLTNCGPYSGARVVNPKNEEQGVSYLVNE